MNKSISLIEELQRNRKYNPFHKDFDYNAILHNIKSMKTLSKEEFQDANTTLCTLFFNPYFTDFIWFFETNILPLEIDKQSLINCLLSIANAKYYYISNKMTQDLEDKNVISTKNAFQTKIKPAIDSFSPVDVDSAITNTLDGLNMAITIISKFAKSTHNTNISPEIFNIIHKFYEICIFSYFVKESYDAAVWNNMFCIYGKEANRILIKYKNKEIAKANQIGKYRLTNNIVSHSIVLQEFVKNAPDGYEILLSRYKQYRKNIVLKSCEIKNNYIKYELKEGYEKQEILFNLITLSSPITIFYDFIWDVELPKYKNLTLTHLLLLLHELEILISSIPQPIWSEKPDIFHNYYFKILIHDLETYLLNKTTFNIEQIRNFLILLEHEHNRIKHNFWDKLIIKHDDYYTFPLANIAAPHVLYLIDEWLNTADYNLTQRGNLFEEYIKQILNQGMKQLKYFYILPKEQEFSIGNRKEEIDIIFNLKHSVLIGDIKCIKYPLEAIDYHNSWDALIGGIKQVNRKVDFILENRKFLSKNIGDIENKEIIKVVITNYPLYSGIKIDDVLIIDFLLLDSYVTSGEFGKKIFHENQSTTLYSKKYYTNEDEFSINLRDYLEKPPAIKDIENLFYINQQKISLVDTPAIHIEYVDIRNS